VKVLVVGAGAVGARAVRQLVESDDVDEVVVVDADRARQAAVVETSGPKATSGGAEVDVDAVLLAGPAGTHAEAARQHVAAGRPVVSTSDSIEDVRGLLDLDAEARARRVAVVAGAAFSPGYSCVLARHAAAGFDTVTEVHIARSGTGGPACARQHHAALTGQALDWRDGGWSRRTAGSGRELCWFPDPIGAEDCYRAELPDALLLVPTFPGVERVTARLAATRRDRFSAHLPMLRKPHPEGLVGAVRVEVRGCRGAVNGVRVLGALDRPAVAAAATAALALRWAVAGRLPTGAAGLGAIEDPVPFLLELTGIGIKAAVFQGGSEPAMPELDRAV
jgi:saccharopine dehydrogenase-like NADP-dependent oxidoreductase